MSLIDLQTLPNYYHDLKDQRLIIIGNGPSASGQAVGPQIDAFDRVIRINNYVTRGMETHVGERTDIWVNGANQGLHKRKDLPAHILVMVPPVELKRKGDLIQPRIEKRLGTKDYFMLPVDTMATMEITAGIDRPTTGFFTIYFFFLLGCDITLLGFDFFVGSTAHYFDGAVKRFLKEKGVIRKAAKHDVNQEKQFVEALIKKGEIKLLKS